MGRPKKPIEVPGQEPETGAELITGTTGEATAPGPQRAEPEIIQQRVASLLDVAALAERNTLLGTINEQGAAIIARFETGLHRPCRPAAHRQYRIPPARQESHHGGASRAAGLRDERRGQASTCDG